MADIEFKWKNRSFYEVRSAPQVVEALENLGRHVLDEANSRLGEDGYEMTSEQGARRPFGRWQVRVFTRTNKAKAAEARDHHLNNILGIGVQQ
jgi:hypothetical protein